MAISKRSPQLAFFPHFRVQLACLSKHADPLPCGSPLQADRLLDDEDACAADVPASKGIFSRNMKHHPKEFLWVGSPWTCRKRRLHYQSFCRNGVTISVHDFVYVTAEESKRLVAYLEDLYVDSKANNMVVVRWFHKIDEVGIVFPPNFNDREIYFSLCLQDLNVECIDGLATILSPQHFEKFMNEATHTSWDPYLCYRQFDSDNIKLFDITQVKGYWNQELLRYMYTSSLRNGMNLDGNASATQTRPKRKNGRKKGDTGQHKKMDPSETAMDIKNPNSLPVNGGAEMTVAIGSPAACFVKKEVIKPTLLLQLSAGSHVEVLSQDSGIRGCWFRAVVIKRNQIKVKVRYEDIRDADETGNLEEWILASRVAVPDKLGVRLHGRTTIRPHPPIEGRVSWVFDVGTAVDAWWFDGWWEGIVVREESKDNVLVYFPGEGRTSIFGHGDLRHSQDWVRHRWHNLEDRPDLVSSILSEQAAKSNDGFHQSQMVVSDKQARNKNHVDTFVQPDLITSILSEQTTKSSDGCHQPQALFPDKQARNKTHVENSVHGDMGIGKSSPSRESSVERGKEVEAPDLAKDDILAHLKWNSSKKRRWVRDSLSKGCLDLKRQHDGSSSSGPEVEESSACKRFSIPKTLKVDHDICKYGGDSLFIPSMPPLSSLVMSM
ncbi:uncharacterized protein LOC143863692 isoform X2 [Tasmannia lanceolata]|uniref:uncharacterized protein LOC143863692 isoform X2 n=1 Tax=Tasmannia lanceolata TaxID=3420 RepID=UPI004063814F